LTPTYQPSTFSPRSTLAVVYPLKRIFNMLGNEEDVFDSVTWDAPADKDYDAAATPAVAPVASGPGFRQSTSESDEHQDPNEPKWEGYMIASVRDPLKEMADTKDAYVSYLVSAEVCSTSLSLRRSINKNPLQTNLPMYSTLLSRSKHLGSSRVGLRIL
jgi:hypothetical protein